MKLKWNRSDEQPASKTVAGGFVLITGTALLAAWWAYKKQMIRLRDLRVWFACCELIAQRRASGAGSRFRPGPWHVSRLTGTGEAAAQATIRRLVSAGILASDDRGFSFPDSLDVSFLTGDSQIRLAVHRVSHPARRVPVPRRMLRRLARSTRPVFIATAIGHLLRCLYYRDRLVFSSGLCKAGWIAAVFGVDERNVKAARRELAITGWLSIGAASQRFLNRWGLPTRVNLEWSDTDLAAVTTPVEPAGQPNSPPPPLRILRKSPPPLKNSHRFQRSRNHVPHVVGGARMGAGRFGSNLLGNFQLEDLRSDDRLQMRFDAAVQAGLVQDCEADKLRFVAAAERALALAKSNPPGFFATVIRRALWHVISQRDEDAAHRRMRRRKNLAGQDFGAERQQAHDDSTRPRLGNALTRAGLVATALIAPIVSGASIRSEMVRSQASRRVPGHSSP